MLKILIGGSPCTHWSIAKGVGRETEAEGIGWELFRNYLIAKEKFKPHFFLYENNKSIDPAIKRQISRELRVPLQHINSALVSAQNRERFYAHNFGDVPLPADKGIVLQDILESGITWRDKSYCIDASYYHGGNLSNFENQSGRRIMVAEPVEYVVPKDSDVVITDKNIRCKRRDDRRSSIQGTQVDFPQGKARTLCASHAPMTTIRVCQFNKGSQGDRIYSVDGKAICISANGGGGGAKTGLYACPIPINPMGDKARTLRSSYYKDGLHNFVMNDIDKKTAVAQPIDPHAMFYDKPIYEVRHGLIAIKKKLYKIKLPDGFYVIRKLSVTECARLQTMPDDYCRAVSPTQGYRGLGNGWTADIIIHLLNHALRNIPRDEKVTVLSMYDGIATGRYCFEKMGFTNVSYHAYEIDKYAIQVAKSNFDNIVECGDAFQVRDNDWCCR